jgi:hypothetical protein
LETLPNSIERTPVSPREPITIAATSQRSAVSTMVFQTGPAALMATGSASRPASFAMRTPSSAAAAGLGGRAIDLDEIGHAGAHA